MKVMLQLLHILPVYVSTVL